MLNMERCETCAHWRPYATMGDDWPSARTRSRSEGRDGWGWCEALEGGSWDPNRTPAPIAYTQDASRYWSALICRAEFGCAMHEPADA